jgi:hypothetical protein
VEGTGSYGAGLARFLRRAGVEIVEVDRPSRQARRRAGKSDPLDAIEAARAALSGRARGAAKSRDGNVEAIRALVVAKRSARSTKIQALNQIRHLSFTAPDELRQRLAGVSRQQLAAKAAALRPGSMREGAGQCGGTPSSAQRCQGGGGEPGPLGCGQPPGVSERSEELADGTAAADILGREPRLVHTRGGGGRFHGWFSVWFGCNACTSFVRRLHPVGVPVAPRSRRGVRLLHPVGRVIHGLAGGGNGLR